MITSLHKLGVKFIFADKSYNDDKYKAWDKGHPNKRAWEEIADCIGKELNF